MSSFVINKFRRIRLPGRGIPIRSTRYRQMSTTFGDATSSGGSRNSQIIAGSILMAIPIACLIRFNDERKEQTRILTDMVQDVQSELKRLQGAMQNLSPEVNMGSMATDPPITVPAISVPVIPPIQPKSIKVHDEDGQDTKDFKDTWQGKDGLEKAKQKLITEEQSVMVPLSERTRDSVLDVAMVARLMVGKYKNTYRGHVVMKDSVSLHHYERLMDKIRPKTIIELGTAGGGGAVWLAASMKAQGIDGQVVTLDIEDRITESCKTDFDKLGIQFVQTDLRDAERTCNLLKDLPHPWLISEDCHVDAEIIMKALDDAMCPGDYIVYEDTHLATPDKSWLDAEDMENYVYGNWAKDKLDRVDAAMLARADRYMIDASIQDLYGYNGSTFINSVFAKVK